MKIIEHTFENFHDIAKKKRIIAFAATDFLKVIAMNYKDLCLDKYIQFIVDNDKKKHGETVRINGVDKKIMSPEELFLHNNSEIAILIATDAFADEIYEQLEGMMLFQNTEVFFLPLLISKHVDDTMNNPAIQLREGEEKIPKIIHYFWFSKEEKPESVKMCIESWRHFCPDYELIEWNADTFDVTCNDFAYEAFQQRKWAYVSDYARLAVVYQHGGIYLDSDVRLFKGVDSLLHNDFFIGYGPIRDVEAAVFGAKKGCDILAKMMEIYQDRTFDLYESMTLENLQPMLLARFLETQGFVIDGKYLQRNGVTIYPRDLFSAKNWFTYEYEMTDTAIGIHECVGGWNSSKGKSRKQIRKECNQKLEELEQQSIMGRRGNI